MDQSIAKTRGQGGPQLARMIVGPPRTDRREGEPAQCSPDGRVVPCGSSERSSSRALSSITVFSLTTAGCHRAGSADRDRSDLEPAAFDSEAGDLRIAADTGIVADRDQVVRGEGVGTEMHVGPDFRTHEPVVPIQERHARHVADGTMATIDLTNHQRRYISPYRG